MTSKSTLPTFIAERMQRKELTPSLRELSRVSGVSTMTLSYNLSGARTMSIETANTLARILGTTIDELVTECRLV